MDALHDWAYKLLNTNSCVVCDIERWAMYKSEATCRFMLINDNWMYQSCFRCSAVWRQVIV